MKAGKQWILAAGAAALLMVAGAIVMSVAGKKQQAPAATPPSVSTAELLSNATRATELDRAKKELAAAQAKLAMNEASAARSALPPPVPPADLTQPPAGGLVLWFDAAKGTIADAAGSAALPNGPVGQWRDLAANAGTAVFQYTASTTKDKETNFPTLRTAPAGAGLLKATPVLTFDGIGDTLCIRDRDNVGNTIGASLSDGNLTVLVVFRNNGPDAPEGLLTFRGGQTTFLSLGVKSQGLIAGPGNAAPLLISGTETEFRIASCTLEAATGIQFGLISADGQKATGEIKMKSAAIVPFDCIRMGTSESGIAKDRSMLAADIAELLVFNRVLDQETRHSAENYLRKKYFGSTGPTVTANSRR